LNVLQRLPSLPPLPSALRRTVLSPSSLDRELEKAPEEVTDVSGRRRRNLGGNLDQRSSDEQVTVLARHIYGKSPAVGALNLLSGLPKPSAVSLLRSEGRRK
jgi:hypothetical protein